jgi:putative membrane protein
MPSAGSEELKALLYKMFSPLSDYLEHAQQIQDAISR